MPSTAVPTPNAALLAALNELLEAERAGARVAMETAREIPAGPLAELVQDIHHDEVRWCRMLLRSVQALGGTPSTHTGAFWGKAMAIEDIPQRLAFLNRGQAWVVRRLRGLMPQMVDAPLRDELHTMLQAHLRNIERVQGLQPTTAPGAQPAGG